MSLVLAVDGVDVLSARLVEEILGQCISGVDDRIKGGLGKFFPGGPAQISNLTDDEIKSTIAEPATGNSYVQIMSARTGTTCLVILIGPLKTLHIANLGHSETCKQTAYLLAYLTDPLNQCLAYGLALDDGRSRLQATVNEAEADRVRAEHPNEPECLHEGRVLGSITLTRAMGDTLFKLPPIYAQRVFPLATPPFHENYKIGELLAKNLMPPYLSSRAEVEHVDLAFLVHSNATPVLILCSEGSDGLCDLYSRRLKRGGVAQDVQSWFTALNREGNVNLALDFLWDALGGNTGAETTSKILRGMPER